MENLTFSSYLSCANPVLISEMKGDECSAVIAYSADGTPLCAPLSILASRWVLPFAVIHVFSLVRCTVKSITEYCT